MITLSFYFAAIILPFATKIEATCFNPDRTVATNAVPCGSNNATFCCASGAICLSTGYCLSATTQPFALYRGSCTDSGWGDFCAYYCVNYETGSNAPIVSVGLNNNSRAIYCCGYQSEHNNATRCSNGDAPFVLDDGDIIFGRAALANVTARGLEPSTTSGPIASATGTTSTQGGNEQCASQDHSTAIGVGVGVSLGILALCALTWALIERRRNRRSRLTTSGVVPATGQIYIPSRRKTGPTELDQPSSANSGTLANGSSAVEIMGSETRHG